ncbi:Cell cycle serine/threonine-protein kinase CDC5/MSD2 [Pleurostoma richardsiae]|uniref:Cell cycle serine/threonine-protein kinase CDC5/MSD2 n=1 Tax=Pleurostoma richardsiae TaxID=41990 RepID=A0AA38S7K0_9PEZI|nr:Cell cycle serine/threonine-protein kinase CDC5/MSD2 [Pleurostoma richardsiae]
MVAKGIDMEALSPRDVNALPQQRPKDLKTKAAAVLKSAKEKEHPPPPPPEVIEPPSSGRRNGATYQVGKLLGKGGFAICYYGKQVESGERYALKIVKSQMPAKMEQKFQTELQIHSKMRQKNIVQFHRAFTFENSTYLVLELCPNGSLMDMVKKRKGLTEPEVRFYTVQISGAIKYMHAKGIIHRDLKMGNIFLDKHMNAKIGDFGLAALLVTGKDMHTIRRTTLCGTPNYIAPEILQKGKVGHDHMVDIWSLGIIVFAMLTSKPPFQSSTTDEIYRRARERDYEWPQTDQKFVSLEAKDLVAIMLQDANRRPDPDTIVQHPFFTAGYVPLQSDISSKLRDAPPDQLDFYDSVSDPEMAARSHKNLMDLCCECAVGPWNQTRVIHSPIWREIAAEEKHGLTPVIPLSANIVYRPYDEVRREQQQQQLLTSQSSALLSEKTEDLTSVLNSTMKAPSGLLRAPPQSFAAQQRAQNRPAMAPPPVRLQPAVADSVPVSVPVRSRSKKEAPLTMSGAISVEAHEVATKSTTRASRTQLPPRKSQSTTSKVTSAPQRPHPLRQVSSEEEVVTLFDPAEHQESVPGSRPDDVLERLRRLQTELERALNSRSMAFLSARDKAQPQPQIVVKWVDYTNKFGLGYILNDGSVGCILRNVPTTEGTKPAMLPPACMLVHDAERHIQRKNDETYRDRHQIVPMSEGIYFYENNGEDGMTRVRVDPQNFRVTVGQDGIAAKLSAGKTVYEHRKRERIVLWKKFANYMLAYGRELDGPSEDPQMRVPTIRDPTAAPSDLVTFYQRFGDVGCWVFCDGHLQFNFPDHTKIVLDATGTFCHFWHLPQEAAERLAVTGSLEESALDDRTVLSYPLQTLLNFSTVSKPAVRSSTRSASNPTRRRPEIAPELQGIPAANDFRRKVDFIKNVVKEWVTNGGIGNSDMSREGRLRWTGVRETKNVSFQQKHVWVTIGARWGDERYTAIVDPRRPAELGPDIDESKKRA